MTRALMIAAPRSGSGKTIVTLGLLRAFRRRGVDVVGLKSGPDYIDPAFHAAASGREGVNLDSWAMPPKLLAALADEAGLRGTLYSTPNCPLWLGPAGPWARISAGRGGKAIEERRRAERAADRFCSPERRDRLSGKRRVEKVGESAPAAIDERRDADEPVVLAFAMSPCARPAPVLGPRDEPRPHRIRRDIA